MNKFLPREQLKKGVPKFPPGQTIEKKVDAIVDIEEDIVESFRDVVTWIRKRGPVDFPNCEDDGRSDTDEERNGSSQTHGSRLEDIAVAFLHFFVLYGRRLLHLYHRSDDEYVEDADEDARDDVGQDESDPGTHEILEIFIRWCGISTIFDF